MIVGRLTVFLTCVTTVLMVCIILEIRDKDVVDIFRIFLNSVPDAAEERREKKNITRTAQDAV